MSRVRVPSPAPPLFPGEPHENRLCGLFIHLSIVQGIAPNSGFYWHSIGSPPNNGDEVICWSFWLAALRDDAQAIVGKVSKAVSAALEEFHLSVEALGDDQRAGDEQAAGASDARGKCSHAMVCTPSPRSQSRRLGHKTALAVPALPPSQGDQQSARSPKGIQMPRPAFIPPLTHQAGA